MDAVNRVLGLTIPATTAVPSEPEQALTAKNQSYPQHRQKTVKKIAPIVNNLTESEQLRRELIVEIQSLYNARKSIREIASFANVLSKELSALNNVVASPLSNGFVEGSVEAFNLQRAVADCNQPACPSANNVI